jgi:hypothetical protein
MCCHCVILACDASTLKLWTSDLPLDLGQVKQSQQRGKNVRASIFDISCGRGCIVSLLWSWEQDGPLRISTINAIAAQVCCERY